MNRFTFGERAPLENVNFETKTRLPPINGLKECRQGIVPGMVNVWYEYLPAAYDGKTALPLIVQVHGGGHDGRRWADFTLWHVLAERLGLIVIYPNSPDYGSWHCDDRDVEYLYQLIGIVCEKYNIDRTRIYMQGMSNGDMMTLAFTMQHPEVLAAAGYSTGPSAEIYVGDERPTAALPAIQMRGEYDIIFRLLDEDPIDAYETRYRMNDFNRDIWVEKNGLDPLPDLTFRGKDNFMRFRGKNADLINWEVVGCGHREPADMAQVYWDCLYSGCRRVDGKLVYSPCEDALEPDQDIAVIALGSRKVYLNGRMEEMTPIETGVVRSFDPGPGHYTKTAGALEMLETPVLCAPVEFFRAAFGAEVRYLDAGDRAEVCFPDGNCAIFHSNSLLVEYNGKFRSMRKPCTLLCGTFYVPVGEFCGDFLGKFVSEASDLMLISGHSAILGRYTARVLRKLLGGYVRAVK